jgi:hypothetical protein
MLLDAQHSTVCPANFLSDVHIVSLAHSWIHARGRFGLPNNISDYQQETYRVHLTDGKVTSMTAATDNNVVGNCGPETLWRVWFPNRRLSSKRLLLTDRHFTLLYFRSV